MRKYVAIFGLLLLFPAVLHAADAESLYKRIKFITQSEQMYGKTELSVQRQLPLILGEEIMKLEEEDIDKAIQRDLYKKCAAEEIPLMKCMQIMDETTKAAQKANYIRALGRDLQLIATSYEHKLDGFSGYADNISIRLPSITRIWSSGTDSMTNPAQETKVRAAPWPDGIEAKFSQLEGALKALAEEEDGKKSLDKLASAVWQYRHGYKDPKSRGSCDNGVGDGSELDLLAARWCDVEDALQAIDGVLPGRNDPFFDPPLKIKEIVIFQPKKFEELSVVAWLRVDDVGLKWDIGMEPVLPALTSEASKSKCMASTGDSDYCDLLEETGAVFAGKYPRPLKGPDHDKGICSHPFGSRGYLCRPFDTQEPCLVEEEEDSGSSSSSSSSSSSEESDPNVITLTSCDPQALREVSTVEYSGPNICELGGWKVQYGDDVPLGNLHDSGGTGTIIDTDPEENPELRPPPCANCVVDLECSDECVPGMGGFAYTWPRDENGRIRICLPNQMGESGFLQSLLVHELIHAQQMCNRPANADLSNSSAECCGVERDAYYTQCVIFAEDGILDKFGYTVEQCASAYSNNSCAAYAEPGKNACTSDGFDPAPIMKNIENAIKDSIEELDLPDTCEEAIEKLHPHAISILHSLPRSCSPNCKSRYENTIGNNMCYIGQCMEQSIEEHRIIPGRMAFNANDEAFPWDSCSQPDPQKASFLTIPPLSTTFIPPYRPQFLINQLDMELCKQNGYPARFPPVLCSFNPKKQIALPSGDIANHAVTFIGEQGQQLAKEKGLELSTGNIGARIGSRIFTDYLDTAMKNFTELLKTASTIMHQIGETNFSRVMCPRYHTSDCSLFEPTP